VKFSAGSTGPGQLGLAALLERLENDKAARRAVLKPHLQQF
jgi:hypothetical protein